MQSNTDIQQHVFSEAQKLLEQLSKANNTEELISKQELISELQDYVSFLKVSAKYTTSHEEVSVSQEIDNQELNLNEEKETGNNYQAEEEVIFNNELNEIEESEIDYSEPVEELEEEAAFNNELNKIEELEEEETKTEIFSETLDKDEKEAKIKLANIRGLKKEEAEIVEEAKEKNLLNANISTSYMEAEKEKPLFKLDLNDKIAFTKTLFSGNQSELDNTISQLNSFKTLDEAKEYLSDLYYEKKWENQDEYAQRLWSLVENKFM